MTMGTFGYCLFLDRSLRHIDICRAKFNVLNGYVGTSQEEATGHKDAMGTNRVLEGAD